MNVQDIFTELQLNHPSPRQAAAPTMAYSPGVMQSAPGEHQPLKMSRSWWRIASCSMHTPRSRPAMAPTAILGMNKPDGTWRENKEQDRIKR